MGAVDVKARLRIAWAMLRRVKKGDRKDRAMKFTSGNWSGVIIPRRGGAYAPQRG